MSRDLNKAVPFLKDVVTTLIAEAKRRYNLNVFVVDVDRDYRIQRAYFAQGREHVAIVNELRRIANLPLINAEQNLKKITWTMNSKHITNAQDGDPNNDLSRAVDLGLKDYRGRYMGNVDADVNGDNKHDYEQVGALAEELGAGKIKWGGRFGDEPHIEVV